MLFNVLVSQAKLHTFPCVWEVHIVTADGEMCQTDRHSDRQTEHPAFLFFRNRK